MSDLKFSCPHCQQHLEAPEDMLGQSIPCPACNGEIKLPGVEPAEVAQPLAPSTPPAPPAGAPRNKSCPLCGETILLVAQKCKHCGEFLDKRSQAQAPHLPEQSAAAERTLYVGHPSHLCYIVHYLIGFLFLLAYGLGFLFIIYAVLDQRNRIYTLTTRKVMSKVGIISRKTQEVAIRDIRCINLRQGIIQRLLGLGSVQVGSAGTGGVEINFAGITRPTKVRDAIRATKDEADS